MATVQLSSALPLEQPTGLHVFNTDGRDIDIRTSVAAWWLGLPALLLLPVIVIPGVLEVLRALWALQIVGALAALVFTTIGGGLLLLLVLVITHERLRVTQSHVEWTLRLFAAPLRRKSLLLKQIEGWEVVDLGDIDSTCYKLELRSPAVLIRFGQEQQRVNLERLGEMIARRRGAGG